jgi:hypothetical protein
VDVVRIALLQGDQRSRRASGPFAHSVGIHYPPPQAKENRMPDATSRTLPAEEAVSEIATLLARGYQRLLREEASQLIKTNNESSEDGLAIQPEQSVHALGGQRHAPPSATGESKQGEDA